MNNQDRIKELNDYKDLCKKILDENKLRLPKSNNWEKRVIEKNTHNLKSILKDINVGLRKENVSQYVISSNLIDKTIKNSNYEETGEKALSKAFGIVYDHLDSFILIPKIFSNTLFASIEYDINWLSHITLKEQLDIATGNKNPNILVKYIPALIDKINNEKTKLLSYYHNPKLLDNLLTDALTFSKNENYLSSNILLLTIIESITINLIRTVYKIQNPQLSENEVDDTIFNKYGSLTRLIRQLKLKPDLQVSYLDAAMVYKYSTNKIVVEMDKIFEKHKDVVLELKSFIRLYEFEKNNQSDKLIKVVKSRLNHLQNLIKKSPIKNPNDTRLVPLTVQLEFISRRIKEDRNSILHGQFHPFEHNWKNQIYLSAILKLIEIYENYKIIYPNLTT